MKGLKFDAWAHHPYPTSPNLPPLQKVRYPNVTLSTLPSFEKTLKTCVPPHGADLDHRVRPRDEAGRAARRLDGDPGRVREAGADGREERSERADVHLVRLPRLAGEPVAERPRAARAARTSRRSRRSAPSRKLTDGTDRDRHRPGKAPAITIYVPYLSHYSATGTQIGVFYTVYDGTKIVARATPTAPLGIDQSVKFTPAFTPAKGHTYSVVAVANEPNGHSETRTTVVDVA